MSDDRVVELKSYRGYIAVEQCDLDFEKAIREAYAVNGPVVSLIAEFREQFQRVDPSIESLQAEVERLRFERDDARKALFQMRDMLIAVHDGLEDEGDRVYLGSSNHAELIHEAWHYADAIKWDAFLEGDPAAKEQTR